MENNGEIKEILKQETETKMFQMPADDSKGSENINVDDNADLSKAPEIHDDTATPKPPKKKFSFDVEKTADLIVDGIDGIQQAGFTLAYSMACFTKENRQAIKALTKMYKNAKKSDKSEITLTEKDLELMSDYEEFESYTKDVLPFSDKESEGLKSALAGMMEDMNFEPSPKKALMISAALISIPRILPITFNFVQKMVSGNE